MADNTLKDYLIALGFTVDDATWRKYVGAVSTAGRTTTELGSAAVETATAIEVAVAGIARQYQSLYYLSQSTGRSIGAIQSYQYGLKQVGIGADEAAGAIESMAETARTLPGVAGLFGGATDPEAVVEQLKNARVMYAVAKQMAALRGVPGGVFERLWLLTPEDRRRQRESQQDFTRWLREAGVDSRDFGNRVVEVNTALNAMEGHLEVAGQRFFLDFGRPVAVGLGYVGRATQVISDADEATHGWVITLATLAASFAGGTFLTGLLGKAAGFSYAGTVRGVGGFLLRRFPLLVAGAMAYEIEQAVADQGSSDALLTDEMKRRLAGQSQWKRWAVLIPTVVGNWIGENVFGVDPGATHPDLYGNMGGRPLDIRHHEARRGRPDVGARGLASERMSEGVQMLVDSGYSREAALGVMSGLYYESGRTLSPTAFNPAGGGRGAIGVPQLRGGRIDEAGKFLDKPFEGASFHEQMEYVVWALEHSADEGARVAGAALRDKKHPSAGESARIFLSGFERPGPAGAQEIVDAAALAEQMARNLPKTQAPRAVPESFFAGAPLGAEGGDVNTYHISNKTDIHVSGNVDRDVADQIVSAQDRVGDDFAALVRNTASPHR